MEMQPMFSKNYKHHQKSTSKLLSNNNTPSSSSSPTTLKSKSYGNLLLDHNHNPQQHYHPSRRQRRHGLHVEEIDDNKDDDSEKNDDDDEDEVDDEEKKKVVLVDDQHHHHHHQRHVPNKENKNLIKNNNFLDVEKGGGEQQQQNQQNRSKSHSNLRTNGPGGDSGGGGYSDQSSTQVYSGSIASLVKSRRGSISHLSPVSSLSIDDDNNNNDDDGGVDHYERPPFHAGGRRRVERRSGIIATNVDDYDDETSEEKQMDQDINNNNNNNSSDYLNFDSAPYYHNPSVQSTYHPSLRMRAPSIVRHLPTLRRESKYFPGRIRKRVILKSGNVNLSPEHVEKRSKRFLQDMFTTMVDIRWRWNLLVFALGFLMSWFSFAIIWWLIAFSHSDFEHLNDESWTPCIVNMNSFAGAILFSIETQHTIGYGSRSTSEECPEAIFVMCIQSITGVVIQCFMVGFVFAKLSRPQKRSQTLMFSRHAITCLRDGKLLLQFRVGDLRDKSHIIGAKVAAQLIKKRLTDEGEVIPHYHKELTVRFDEVNSGELLLIYPAIIVHDIDEDSPFYNMNCEAMMKEKFEIVVFLEGTVESTGQSIQARTSYIPSEILWGHRFEQMIRYSNETGEYLVDYSKFNSTMPMDIATYSAKEFAKELEHRERTKRLQYSPTETTHHHNRHHQQQQQQHHYNRNSHHQPQHNSHHRYPPSAASLFRSASPLPSVPPQLPTIPQSLPLTTFTNSDYSDNGDIGGGGNDSVFSPSAGTLNNRSSTTSPTSTSSSSGGGGGGVGGGRPSLPPPPPPPLSATTLPVSRSQAERLKFFAQ